MKFFDQFQFLAVRITLTDGSTGSFSCRTITASDDSEGSLHDYAFGGLSASTKERVKAFAIGHEISKIDIVPVWRLKNDD